MLAVKKKRQRNGTSGDQRLQRDAALASIRENFNPFETKVLARPKKFEAISRDNMGKRNAVLGRPGVTKSMGEETRRQTLLPEMQRRNKVGGIIDRRLHEGHSTMTPEEKMLQRYQREKQKKSAALFDLEKSEEEELTHAGRSLQYEDQGSERDDFDAESLSDLSDDSEDLSRKRKRSASASGDEESAVGSEDVLPGRKKTKAEVMTTCVWNWTRGCRKS